MAEVDYGQDIDWADDMSPTAELVSGVKLLSQAVYRRLITPKGSCLDSPDDGLALEDFLHEGLTEAELAAIPGQVRQEILKDDRIIGVDIEATKTLTDGLLGFELAITCTPSEGPDFDLTISVSAAAVKLLSANEAS